MGAVRRALWNERERRPRAAIRIAAFAVLVFAVLFGVGWGASPLWRSGAGGAAVAFAIQASGVVLAAILCAKWIDRRPLADLGLAPRPGYALDLAAGAAIGGLCMGAIAGLESALGWARYAPAASGADEWLARAPTMGSVVVLFVGVAVLEEVAFRSYPIVNLAEGLVTTPGRRAIASWAALVATSAAFGIAHVDNPEATATSTAFIAFGGVFLGLGLVCRGDLAIPIGAHLGWNFFQNLFGMPVSGQSRFHDGAALVRVPIAEEAWTGGPFGPEAGLEGLVAMGLGIGLTVIWLRARGSLHLAPALGVAPVDRTERELR
jgi:membrane protease YdiL (CAAX protease family)